MSDFLCGKLDDMDRTWVVVPMYNEGSMISSVIADLKRSFSNIVCVDDGSTDDSVAAATSAGASVVSHPINLGQGASLQTGFEFALSDLTMTDVVTFDADGQHQVNDAVAMVTALREGQLDIVIGSRFLDQRTSMGVAKRCVLRAAAVFTRATTGMALTDAHNGLRVIRRDLVSRISLKQNRMAHASELVDQVSALKVRWAEFPTHIVYTEYSKKKGQSLLNAVNILVEIVFR
ncbi:MAG: glycosyltransferase family 2 protein [Rhodoglobus sp.]